VSSESPFVAFPFLVPILLWFACQQLPNVTRAESLSTQLTVCFHRDEQLTDLDLEILHLGEDNRISLSASSQSSPKRARSADQDDEEGLGLFANDADGESEGRSEEPLPKRRRSERQMPAVETRIAALQELSGKRKSRAYRKSTRSQAKSPRSHSKTEKPKKKKKTRRLPVNELVTLSERRGDTDIEAASSKFNIPCT
jgi:hypothetical protein